MLGKTISHYKILEKLGEGGMGVVYKAQDTKLDRLVALKFLPPELTRDDEAKERFIHEAKAASTLQHNNICTIHDIDEMPDGQIFIVMDCYEGETLKEKIKRGLLKIEEAVDISMQIAQGLEEAHKHQIVHRDIKPANIFITKDGIVKILDFGLAKLAGRARLTKTRTTVGTVAYMSPEQVRGEEVDHRTDIWSLGVVLYEMLTGRLPFEGEYEAALLYSIINENPQDVATSRPEAPSNLRTLLQKCLQKDPKDRLQSMQHVVEMTSHPVIQPIATSKSKLSLQPRTAWPLIVLSLVIVGLIVWIIRMVPSVFHYKRPTKWRIGVMPFRNLTNKTEAKDWPLLIQGIFAYELTGIREFGVIESLGLNNIIQSSLGGFNVPRDQRLFQMLPSTDITLIIDGVIRWENSRFLIQSYVVDRINGEQSFTRPIHFQMQEELPEVVYAMANEILDYFQVKAITSDRTQDLNPWIGHRIHIEALKEFLQASQMIFNGVAGARRYLRRSLELDSTFIAPRIWLISGLVLESKMEEAYGHYRVLEALEKRANPFEQTMISWAHAYIQRDTVKEMQSLKLALEYSPNNAILLYNLARTQYMLGDKKGTIESLKPTIEMKWPFSPAWYLLALSYHDLGDKKRSNEIASQSLFIKPVYWGMYSLLLRHSFQEGDSTAVHRFDSLYFKQGKEFGVPPAMLYSRIGQDFVSDGLFNRGIRYYLRGIAEKRDDPDLHYELAEIYLTQGMPDSAIIEFHYALKLDATKIQAHYKLGELYESRKDKYNATGHYLAYLRQDSVGGLADMVRKRLSRLKQ